MCTLTVVCDGGKQLLPQQACSAPVGSDSVTYLFTPSKKSEGEVAGWKWRLRRPDLGCPETPPPVWKMAFLQAAVAAGFVVCAE